jgi:hypothetical protein
MNANKLVLFSVLWTVFMAGMGVLGAYYIVRHPIPGASLEERSGQIGTGVGILTGVGYGFIWIPWAYRVGQERRAEQKRLAKKASRRKRR